MTPTPPRLPETLLRWLLPATMRDYVLGDMAEDYRLRVLPRRGRVRAGLWYWRQVAMSLAARRAPRAAQPQLPVSPRAPLMDSVRQDLRFALRQLHRHPGFALTVVLTLALGIGANTAIFSVVHGIVVRSLPYPEPENLFYMLVVERTGSGAYLVPDPDYATLLQQSKTVDAAAIDETIVMPLALEDATFPVSMSRVHHGFFDVFGLAPLHGRVFRPSDSIPIEDPSTDWRPYPAVISHRLWQRHFGADPNVIGTAVELQGMPTHIVGVMPADFRALLPPRFEVGTDIDVWVPTRYDYSALTRDQSSRIIGRTRDGRSLAQAQHELDAITARLAETDAFFDESGYRFELYPLHDGVVGGVRSTLLLLLGAVGFVLLIACANVANLLMARGASRHDEIATRAALGAGRGRIVRQVLTESAMLSALGMALGVGLAVAGIRLLKSLGPDNLPRLGSIGLQPQVLGFSVMLAGGATLLYGVLPALAYARHTGPGSDRTVAGSRRQRRMQGSLAVAQVALSIVLLSGATLMLRSFQQMQLAPVGFDPQGLLTFRTNLIGACPFVDGQLTGCGREQRRSLEYEVFRAIGEIPGVQTVGGGFPLPMNGIYTRVAAYSRDELRDDETARHRIYFRTVSETYLEAMGIELLAGRTFTPADGNAEAGTLNVIVDRRLAEREWPGDSPLGKQIALFDWSLEKDTPYRVIGVAEYVPQWDHWDDRPTVYIPRWQWPSIEVSVAARTSVDPATLVEAARDKLRGVHPDLPFELVHMQDLVAATMAPTGFVLALLAVFSSVAMLLASVGLYGVLNYGVRQRLREIGIRMALGASGKQVSRQVARGGLLLAGIGVALGLTLALALGGAMQQQLYGIAPRDPAALLATVVLVALVALAATFLPARRAAAADPAVVLRDD